MPKVGVEAVRKAEFLEAMIAEVGDTGRLTVTVAQIARRAGVSSALAHHYFGGKEQMQTAAMRKILRDYGACVRRELQGVMTPAARVDAILRASFSREVFTPATLTTWMAFYGQAQAHKQVMGLLTLYQRRLHSNLCYALRDLCDDPEEAAHIVSAFIDGVYLRAGLTKQVDNPIEQGRKLLHALLRPATKENNHEL